jgi:RNA polymerase sigma-70 factor (ECF subfamily)
MTGGEGACLDLGGSAHEQTRFGGGSKVVSAKAEDPRELFLELRAPICRYLVSLGLDRAAAEDVAQESFLRLCERDTQKDSNVKGWIFRVAHNLARDEQRRKVRRPTVELEREDDYEYPDGRPSPEKSLLDREKEARLKSALARLPEEQRQCLHLRAEGLRYREIGEVLGAGTSTIAEWVQKGLKQLGRELA